MGSSSGPPTTMPCKIVTFSVQLPQEQFVTLDKLNDMTSPQSTRTCIKSRGPQQKDGSWHEEFNMVLFLKQATGLHSPTSTKLELVPLRRQPGGRATFLEFGVGEHES